MTISSRVSLEKSTVTEGRDDAVRHYLRNEQLTFGKSRTPPNSKRWALVEV